VLPRHYHIPHSEKNQREQRWLAEAERAGSVRHAMATERGPLCPFVAARAGSNSNLRSMRHDSKDGGAHHSTGACWVL
jgi:hypothetical protein